MSVVKTLALGVSILSSMVAPTLAGSMRASHQVPDRPSRVDLPQAPTSLVIAPPARVVVPAAENLAYFGGFQPTQTYLSSFAYNPGGFPRRFTSLYVGYSAPTAPPVMVPQPLPAAPVAPLAMARTYVPVPATTPAHDVAALINFGNAPYSEAQALTTGNPQAWYQSTAVQSVYKGTPTAVQQAAFQNEVLQVVQNTYNRSGLAISLTTDPNHDYAHTMSVVAGASFPGNSGAIGITDVGNDGFSFIDKFGMARTPSELATAVGQNVAHELMHAFGVAGHPDQSGQYLDAATANWNTLIDTETTFSPQAVQMLSTQNFLNGPGKSFTLGTGGLTGLEVLSQHHLSTCHCAGCASLQTLEAAEGLANGAAAPVPEPTTVALWGCAALGAVLVRHRRRRQVQP